MVSFRRFALVLAVLACFAGLVSAQVLNTPVASTSVVRAEGVTELLPSVSFTTKNAVTVASTYNITIYSSVTVTSATGEIQLTVAPSTTPVVGTSSGNTITFLGVPLTALSTGVTINGIRVDATQLPSVSSGTSGVGATLLFYATPTDPSYAALFTTGAAGATTAVQSGILAYAVPSFKAYVSTGAYPPVAATPSTQSICVDSPFDPTKDTTGQKMAFYVAATETYSGAFRTLAGEQLGDTAATYATSGTQLQLTFANTPANVTLYVPTLISDTAGTFTLSTGAGAAAGKSVAVPASGIVTYTVTASTNGLDAINIPVYAAYTGTPALTTSTTAPTVSVVFAPVSSASSVAIPRFGGTAQTSSTFTTAACSTALLFPYVVATGGYDTGLSIANTASDPDSDVNGTTGACTWYFYGNGAPAKPVVGDAIAPGAISAVVLSGIAPGFQGYAIAQCAFNYAHGYSFVINGNTGATASYLPVVITRGSSSPEPTTF